MNDEIIVWGAGAIGGTLSAYWARSGKQVKMVDIMSVSYTHLRAHET